MIFPIENRSIVWDRVDESTHFLDGALCLLRGFVAGESQPVGFDRRKHDRLKENQLVKGKLDLDGGAIWVDGC